MVDKEHIKSDQKEVRSQATPRSLLVERLYRTHAASLVSWLRRRFGEGPPEPEDIAQSTFAKLSDLHSVDHIDNFRAFLFAMASNIAVSAIRSNIRARKFLDDELSNVGGQIEKITPLRVYEAKQALQRLSIAFEGLTKRQQEIVIRSRLYGQTYAEIRSEKGWSLGTIAADMKEAMKILAEIDDESEPSEK